MSVSVTIGLPVFNGEEFLDRALDALLAQEYDSFEILISDNASTDGTAEICARWSAHDDRVRYVCQPHNLGPKRNFGAVLAAARSPYFAWAAHDDLWEPSFLAKLAVALDQNPDAVLACCDYDVHHHATGERVCHPPSLTEPFGRANGHADAVTLLLRSPQPVFIYGLFRTGALQATRAIRGSEFDFNDLLILTEVALQGPITWIPETLFHAGVRGRVNQLRGNAERRRGLTLNYTRYVRRSLVAITRAHGFTLRERFGLWRALLRQAVALAYWHEWRSRRIAS